MERKNIESLGPTLLEAFRGVADHPRHGRRHPLPAILTLATCAMLCGCNSLYAIAQWGREHKGLARTLGFSGQTPCVATLHLVFKRMDKEAFEEVLSRWSQEALGDREPAALGARREHGRRRLPGTGGSGAGVMAAIRNVMLNLLRWAGARNIAAARRHYSWKVPEALSLIGLPHMDN